MKYLCSSSIFELSPHHFFSFQPDSQIAALYNMTADKQAVATEIYRLTTYWPKKGRQEKLLGLTTSSNWNILISVAQTSLSFLPAEQRSGPFKDRLVAQIWAVFRDYQRDHRNRVLKVKPRTRPRVDTPCLQRLLGCSTSALWVNKFIQRTVCSTSADPQLSKSPNSPEWTRERHPPSMTSQRGSFPQVWASSGKRRVIFFFPLSFWRKYWGLDRPERGGGSDDGKIKFYERFMKTLWNFNKSKSHTKPLFSLTEW